VQCTARCRTRGYAPCIALPLRRVHAIAWP
jgi:hypothetical protein